MVKFRGDTRLTEKGVVLNTSYTNHEALERVYEIVPGCIDRLSDKLNKKRFSVNICYDKEEYEDASKRAIKKIHPSFTREDANLEFKKQHLGFKNEDFGGGFTAGLAYSRDINPTLIIYWPSFKFLDDSEARGTIYHELGHTIQIDEGYDELLAKPTFTFARDHDFEMRFDDSLSSILQAFIRHSHHEMVDMSANEIIFDEGLEKDIYNLTNNALERYRTFNFELLNKCPPVNTLYTLISGIGYPIIFKNKNLNEEYENLSEKFLDYSRKFKKIDGENITKDLWKLLEKVKNPPKKEAVYAVYDYTFNKIKDLKGLTS